MAETAKNMSKRSTMTSVFAKMLGISICTVMLAGGIIPTEAQASTLKWGDNAQAKNGTVAIGDNSTAMADNSVALGTGATVTKLIGLMLVMCKVLQSEEMQRLK